MKEAENNENDGASFIDLRNNQIQEGLSSVFVGAFLGFLLASAIGTNKTYGVIGGALFGYFTSKIIKK